MFFPCSDLCLIRGLGKVLFVNVYCAWGGERVSRIEEGLEVWKSILIISRWPCTMVTL